MTNEEIFFILNNEGKPTDETMTKSEVLNLLGNFRCQKCNGITSFANVICKVKNRIIIHRWCDICGKEYNVDFLFNDSEETIESFKTIVDISNTFKHLCKFGKNLYVPYENCEDCIRYSIKYYDPTLLCGINIEV